MPEEAPEPNKDEEYPTDNLEREALGLPPLLESYRKPNPPQLVRTAFLVLCVGAVLVAAGFIVMLSSRHEITNELIDSLQKAQASPDSTVSRRGLSENDVVDGVPGLLGMLTFGGVVIAALIVLFGYKAREGSRSARARTLAMILVVAVFVIAMPSSFVNPVQIVAVAVSVVAMVMLYLPSVAGYFPRAPSSARRWRG